MRIIYPTTITNRNLTTIDPRIPLITPTLIAGYDCLSNLDFSGRNNNFTSSIGFTSTGATLANNTASLIVTPVIEQSEMTVIGCFNINGTGSTGAIFNNLDTSTTSFKGTRLSLLSSNGGQLDVGTGTATSTLNSIATGVSGAWTIRAWSWNSSLQREIFHSGTVGNSLTITNRGINTARPFSVNGVPSGASGGSITAGVTGTLGFLLFYNETITTANAATRMNIVASIMASRGIVIP
jgi:hypothetical protein